MRLQLNEKKVKGKPDKINELILKMKANLKEGPELIGYHLEVGRKMGEFV